VTAVLPAALAGRAVVVALGLPASRRALVARSGPPRRAVPSLLVGPAVFAPLTLPLGPVGAAVATVLAVLGRRELLRQRRRAERRRERVNAGEAMAVLAGELRAGRAPNVALRSAASVASGPTAVALLEAAGSASLGAAAAEALVRHAEASAVPELLGGLAVCWDVCQGAGSSLAVAVDRLEEALRADQATREEVEAELEGARSTALLLAGLPVLGLGLGSGLGGDPLHVLLRTPVGWVCLCVGVALELLGLWWTGRIVRAAGGDA
jgi:tight adherence protein B